MKNRSVIIKRAVGLNADEIVELFKANYPLGYYNQNFCALQTCDACWNNGRSLSAVSLR